METIVALEFENAKRIIVFTTVKPFIGCKKDVADQFVGCYLSEMIVEKSKATELTK